MKPALLGIAAVVFVGVASAAENPLVLPQNLAMLRCEAPHESARFEGSNAPGQLFLPGEQVILRLAFAKGERSGVAEFAVELQEITTRDPDAKAKGAYADTSGDAPLIGLKGEPLRHPLKVAFADATESAIDVQDFPLPKTFGTYALVLVDGDNRRLLATLARVPRPVAGGAIENTPVFGEGQFMQGDLEERAMIYSRMGIRGWRSELSWSEQLTDDEKKTRKLDPEAVGDYQWQRYDALLGAAEKAGCKVMVTLGGHPWHFHPFGQPTPASRWTEKTGGYWGTAHWMADPTLLPRYRKWITAFCERYWKDGQGGLWGIENYNEPWEGGGISGWAADCRYYRTLQKTITEAVRKVSPDIRILAASSIMNTEDKFYSDGSDEFDRYVDIFTDHYVQPVMCYGPMVARARGKKSMETETWVVNSEYLLPMVMCQFLSVGQERIAPWHPRVLFDTVNGQLIPAPVTTATATFNHFVTGKPFEKMLFLDHLPWVFQFGKDSDRDALLIVFGRLMMAWGNEHERPMAQVEALPGGTLTISNADGLLQFFDMAGNPQHVGLDEVVIPMSIYPTYIRCARGPQIAAQRIEAALLDGKRPVEILPRDFRMLPGAGTELVVAVHNCLNRPIRGTLTVAPPDGIALDESRQAIELGAGETRELSFAVANATPNVLNAYPFQFAFRSDAGDADYRETLNAAVVRRRTPTIDGDLSDWDGVPGITVVAVEKEAERSEQMRRPWLELKDQLPDGSFMEFKLAWDPDNLYVAARVHDTTTPEPAPRMGGRNEDLYFHTAADDQAEPYKTFLAKYPGRSFAEVPYVYRWSPETPPPESGMPHIHFRRDRLHIALDVTDGWHDLVPSPDRVPHGLHAFPDTDYEYALYLCREGSELWRLSAPGVPRIHDFPRQPRGDRTTGPVPGARHVVTLAGNVYTYECAIPKAELADLELTPGTTFGLMLRAGDAKNRHVDYGTGKAVVKVNGLTLKPYWERSNSCGVRWTLID